MSRLAGPRGVEGLSEDLHDPSAPIHSLVRRRTAAGERVYLQTPAGCVGAVDPAGGPLEPVMCDPLGQALRVCRGGAFGAALGSMPFGAPLASDPLAPFGAFGYVADPATGLLASPTRLYDPALGRFLSPDPVGGAPDRPHTLNRYAYAASNPTRYFDPTGGIPLAFIGAAVGGIVGAGMEAVREVSSGQDIDMAKIGIEAGKGAVCGGVAGLTCGASLLPTIGANFAAGAGTQAAGQIIEDWAAGRQTDLGALAADSLKQGAVNSVVYTLGGAAWSAAQDAATEELAKEVSFGMSQLYDGVVKGEATDLVLDPEKRAEMYGKIMGAVDRFAGRQCAQEGQGE